MYNFFLINITGYKIQSLKKYFFLQYHKINDIYIIDIFLFIIKKSKLFKLV